MYVILQDEFRSLVDAELERQHITRSDLAKLMGVSRAMVSQYLNGDRAPGADVIERFFDALGFEPVLQMRKKKKSLQSA